MGEQLSVFLLADIARLGTSLHAGYSLATISDK